MNIISLNEAKQFTLDEAQRLLPLVYRLTEEAHYKVKKLMNQVEALKGHSSLKVIELEDSINVEVERWQNKVKRLGLLPKGVWLADFDSGTGYYCWKFPETEIKYFHKYKDGFSGRIEIQSIT